MIHSCLIANRGEIAVRIIRACRELGISPCVVYSDPDANAPHVRLADKAYPLLGAVPADTYLNIPELLHAAQDMGCESIHPGYGFLSENANFARSAIDAGLIWVGPPPAAIRTMGSKTEARALMQSAGVPVVPGFQDANASLDDYQRAAEIIGYPVMVKAAGGGGGKGIRIVEQAADLADALAAAGREAQSAFGDPRVFIEKYISPARHIEVQIFADSHGNTIHLFERDCSAQRRHQKVIEETPAPRFSDTAREKIGAAAVAAAQSVGYVNAGTVEFIADAHDETTFYFLEMNTRLQVEHPVTELVTGHDLVKLQFHVASGGQLPFAQAQVSQRGHAVECRVYAEDTTGSFLPSTGTLHRLIFPHIPGIRVESGVSEGGDITHYYDPMIAKIISYDSTREGAIRRLDAALAQTVILGVETNIAFLRALIMRPEFQEGRMDTGFIERQLPEMLSSQGDHPSLKADFALIAAALAEHPTAGQKSGDLYAPGNDSWDNRDRFRLGVL
jgi:acetyl-CoA carboxylase biotin carboxylase subunit